MRRLTACRLFFPGAAALLALSAVVPCALPAGADLILPQAPHKAPHRAAWERVWDRIPSGLRPTRDVLAREVSDREMDEMVREDPTQAARQDDTTVDGMFLMDEDGRPTITLRRSLSTRESEMVFAHELGHLVWDTHLTGAEKRAYRTAYQKSRAGKHLVTEYAGESHEEGFAESFAFWVLRPNALRSRDALSFDALEDISARRSRKK